MTMEDYYHLLGLPEAYFLNEPALRQAYLMAARLAHPDHHAQTSDAANAATATVNTAYQTLRDPDTRLAYLLKRYGHLDEAGGSTEQLPPAFLMEVMVLNEAISELQLNPEATEVQRHSQAVGTLQADLQSQLDPVLRAFDAAAPAERGAILAAAVPLYLQQRYVLRLAQQLRSFAG